MENTVQCFLLQYSTNHFKNSFYPSGASNHVFRFYVLMNVGSLESRSIMRLSLPRRGWRFIFHTPGKCFECIFSPDKFFFTFWKALNLQFFYRFSFDDSDFPFNWGFHKGGFSFCQHPILTPQWGYWAVANRKISPILSRATEQLSNLKWTLSNLMRGEVLQLIFVN